MTIIYDTHKVEYEEILNMTSNPSFILLTNIPNTKIWMIVCVCWQHTLRFLIDGTGINIGVKFLVLA